MPKPSIIPGAFFCFAAFVFLLFVKHRPAFPLLLGEQTDPGLQVSISVPTWHRVSFLNVGPPEATTRFGVFGGTGHSPSVGYHFDAAGVTYDTSAVNSTVIYNLTKILILHPIVCGIAFFGFVAGALGVFFSEIWLLIMTMLASLGGFVLLVAFVVDMVVFCLTRSHFNSQGVHASLGNANWLTLAAVFSLIFASMASCYVLFCFGKRNKGVPY